MADENVIGNVCVLKDLLNNTCGKRKSWEIIDILESRFQSLYRASKKRRDDLHKTLSTSENYRVHKSCLLEYTSTDHIKRYLKRAGTW